MSTPPRFALTVFAAALVIAVGAAVGANSRDPGRGVVVAAVAVLPLVLGVIWDRRTSRLSLSVRVGLTVVVLLIAAVATVVVFLVSLDFAGGSDRVPVPGYLAIGVLTVGYLWLIWRRREVGQRPDSPQSSDGRLMRKGILTLGVIALILDIGFFPWSGEVWNGSYYVPGPKGFNSGILAWGGCLLAALGGMVALVVQPRGPTTHRRRRTSGLAFTLALVGASLIGVKAVAEADRSFGLWSALVMAWLVTAIAFVDFAGALGSRTMIGHGTRSPND